MSPQATPFAPGGSENDPTMLGNTPAYNPAMQQTPFTPAVNTEQATPRPGQAGGWGAAPSFRDNAATQIIPSYRPPPTSD